MHATRVGGSGITAASTVAGRAGVLCLALALAACGPPRTRGADGAVDRYVRKVKVSGNKKLSDDAIESGLSMREPRGWIRRRHARLDRFDLERDRARIVAYYRKRGFFRAKVTGVRIAEVGDHQVDVVFSVVEGPAGVVRQLRIEGAPGDPGPTGADLRAASGVVTGKRFDYQAFQDAKWKLRDRLVAAGYARARVTGTARVDRTSLAVTVELIVDPGPRTVFGTTSVTGNQLVPESSIRARLAWEPGDPFEPRALADTRRRLLSMGRFSTVRIDLEGPRDRPAADVKVSVTEAPRNELRLGGGFGVDKVNWLLRGRAGYKRHGVFDPLNTLSVDLRPAYAIVRGVSENSRGLVGEASASLTREDLWIPRLRGTSTIAYTQQELEAYESLGTRLGVGLARGFAAERVRVGVGWGYHVLVLDLVDTLQNNADVRERLGAENNPYVLGFFEQTVAFDGRDNPIDARRGVYAEVRLEESGPYAASEHSYIKLTPELRAYLPLGTTRVVVAARGRLGRTLVGELPLTRRFYAGGASSQRGFAQRRLSPRIADTASGEQVAIGGDGLLETNLEARVDVLRLFGQWMGVVLFADGADATDQTELDAGNLHWAAGFGLRYNTIVGPVRFDLGFRLNRRDELDDDGVAFHLSLGEAF